MDEVSEIKARLPIEQLVGQYCQLQKKGRSFVCLCPFHNDKKPSLLVSPDKGIAYCFACSSGGDIFSFYQKIERVDFPQALKDLAERTGVQLPDRPKEEIHTRDEKERARLCLEKAVTFYAKQLQSSKPILDYLQKRGVTDEEIQTFSIGFAPDSFSATYDYLLKKGFSRSDIVSAGLAIQKDLKEERAYDRFRNRLMFPIHDAQGRIVGFGGRTMGNDDAKYINSPDDVLFHKSQVLFNAHRAKEAMRTTESAMVVEGYFDVLAARRVGIEQVVATCGTALTPDHARLLKRAVNRVLLCLDSDRAGRDAAERAFLLLAPEGLEVHGVVLPDKDPADMAQTQPELLKQMLNDGGIPYIDLVLEELKAMDLSNSAGKRKALERLRPLLQALSTSVERAHYVRSSASALQVTETQLEDDLRSALPPRPVAQQPAPGLKPHPFSPCEITLGIFLLYPQLNSLLSELIAPEEEFAVALYTALKNLPVTAAGDDVLSKLDLSQPHRERASILQLFCEEHGFGTWSELMAPREIRSNIITANREFLHKKQLDITQKLLTAQRSGKKADEELLRTQYQQLLKLSAMAR